MEQKLKLHIGDLVFGICNLSAQIEQLQKENDELKITEKLDHV
jgi:cell division protein FtsB